MLCTLQEFRFKNNYVIYKANFTFKKELCHVHGKSSVLKKNYAMYMATD